MTDWQDRLFQEYKELGGKIIKLETFLNSYFPSPEEEPTIALMEIQYNVMKAYHNILYLRIKNFMKGDD